MNPPDARARETEVHAVVVTWNRCELLIRCIQAIQMQSHAVARIWIIDNGSTDGTRTRIPELFPDATLVAMPFNSGGAGGFHEGMKRALAAGCTHAWLMDDDGAPAPDCLEQQIAHGAGLGIAGSLVTTWDDPTRLAFGLGAMQTISELPRDSTVIEDLLNPFNGTLITAETMRSIGLVKAEMFIWGDETEYILRARNAGIAMGTVRLAAYSHPPLKGQFARVLPGLPWKVLVKPMEREPIWFRNLGFIDIHRKGIRAAVLTIAKHTAYLLARGEWRRWLAFLHAYAQGARDRFPRQSEGSLP